MEVRQLGLTFVSIKSLLGNFSCLLVSVWDNNVNAFTQFDLTVNVSSHSAICRRVNLLLLLCHCFELNNILNQNCRKHFSCLLRLLKCILCIWEGVSVFVSLCLYFARLSPRVFIGNPHHHNNNHLSALQQVFMTCWWLCPRSCNHMSFSQRTTPSLRICLEKKASTL